MIVHAMEQRTPEWFAARLGKLTGSCASKMLATVKVGEAAQRRDLRVRLCLERITGRSQDTDGYVNAEMQRGIDLEPAALAAYEALTGNLAMTCGFVAHDSLPMGCSPDGYVGEWEGLVSLKCPKSATHLAYLTSGTFPVEYEPQMLHELMLVPSAQFYDFLSFDDRFVDELQCFHVRVMRSSVEQAIAAYWVKAEQFLREVDTTVDEVVKLAAVRRGDRTAA